MHRARLLLALWLTGCASDRVEASEQRPRHDPALELSVLSYNVNYGLAGDPSGLAAILDAGTDLVLLQETTPEWEQALRGSVAVTETWPHLHFHHCCGAGGLAILSRWPVAELEILDPPNDPDAWFPAARAVIATPSGPLEILDVHLRPPVKTAEQGWLGALSSTPAVRKAEIQHYLPSLAPELPTIIAGDFNEGDGGSALDVLAEQGFVDVLAQLRVRGHTWRWGGLRARLDHVLVDHELEPIRAEILDAGRSDHLPLRVVVRRR
ncbi:MAG TPA: endonuclease/exonuclease/phosphatase family protein [Enhygromyxa sp.]|nr:endonuclease/exonuclease/phosphatase family protein [Enhygromyxa sp.]